MESMSREILQAAIDEGRCSEFIECLWDGGSATVDARTGNLVLISGDQLSDLTGGNDEPGRQVEALDAYRRKPGGGAACHICGHRFTRHESSTACLRAALLAISDALSDNAPSVNAANDSRSLRPDT